ncbi:single-stranded DNA-binding protein [Spirosoma sp. KUDC1026]|uniref:single-stranded DNA-binding protein n=1 Tax=Spirosoma sp. KUDC1026 TaxID=2745947 RepID=UPI00159BAC32|nr:single-stranded DNA-binding protein [Spirosoma sp. KUDC1026]QKZ15901.1 single-stranded DNA-binding protein [Spirosoma sp. KUDC1026]
MAALNKVQLIGNVGKDPVIRTTQSGSKIVSFSLACSETWRDKSTGERKEKTEWVNVVVFNERLVDVAEKYIAKGGKVYVEGQLQTRKWQGDDGRDNYATEVVLQQYRGEIILLGDKRESGESDDDRRARSNQRNLAAQAPMNDFLDDDIPF